jgi:sugar lactone lactonase YvrE
MLGEICVRLLVVVLIAVATYAEPLYRVESFAGTNYAGDGQPAVIAPLIQPQGLAVDQDGSIIVADAADNRVRRILPNGLIATVAAGLRAPYGVAIGANREIYIADLGSNRVRLVMPDGTLTTFAGGGDKLAVPGTPIKATEAKLDQPRNIAVDFSGAVYISDFGANRIYRVTSDGILVALPEAGLRNPAGLAIDGAGAIYVADSGNHRVQKIANGKSESLISDFGAVTSIALDGAGRIFVAGGDHIAVVAPWGEVSSLQIPADEVMLDATGRVLTVAYRQVRSYFKGNTTILAGNGFGSYFGDGGPRNQWRFQNPIGVSRDEAGTLYIADTSNGRVRRVAPDGSLSTLSAALGRPAYFALDNANLLYFSEAKSGTIYTIDRSGRLQIYSQGSGAKPFRSPSGIGFDSRGDLYVADTGNGLLRKVTPDGFVSTIAGGGSSEQDGFGLSLQLKNPCGIAVGSDGTVWFTETDRLRKLTRDGKVATIPGVPLLDARGLHFDGAGRMLIADAGGHRVLRVTPDGKWEPVAGSGERGDSGDDGIALQATFDAPTDVLPEPDGSILVSDTGNSRIRKLIPFEEAPAATPSPEEESGSFRILRVENFDGTLNSADNPAARGSEIALITAGPGKVDIHAEVAGITAEITSSSQGKITMIVPSGYVPTGALTLQIWIGGVKIAEDATIICR